MKIMQYTRKPFPVGAVQVSLENINDVAAWCKGTVEMVPTKMLGTETLLPVVKIQGQGDNRGKEFTATLGCYVVELKGSYRVYKPAQFDSSFMLVEEEASDETEAPAQEDESNNNFVELNHEAVDDGQPTAFVHLAR